MKNGSRGMILAVILVVLLVGGFFAYRPIAEHLNLGLDLRGGLHVVLQADETKGDITADTIQKSVGIIRDRVDKLGVEEPVIYPQGNDRIVVELAGVANPEEAVNIIKNTAQLEFWDEQGNVLLTGAHLKDAQAEVRSDTGEAVITLEFNDEGTELFAKATQENLNKPLAIVIDNNVISAPTVRSVVNNGRAEISGSFTAESAQNLAVLLRSGALPVSFQIMEKRTVGPTLGADSLQKSTKAGLLGVIAIFIFMLGYYRLPGLVADISLLLYALLVLGTMSLMGAVLTLPGIAGFVLSIGMAVDANVIIFERIKEELRTGKSLHNAVESGFKRAFSTILDANLTTLITAGVLMYFGTGPIKGFAVTLSIGIIFSVLVAMTFTRYFLKSLAYLAPNHKLYGV